MANLYFAVVKYNGREAPQLFHDEIPRVMRDKNAPLVYCCKLTDIGQIDTPLAMLYAEYCRRRDKNTLPPQYRGPTTQKQEEKRGVLHDHWSPPSVTWDQDKPAYPPLPGQPGWEEFRDRSVTTKDVPMDDA